MSISSIFRFTLFEKLFQALTNFFLILTIARVLSSEDFTNWTIGLGIYLSFLPLIALLPSEVIVRFMQSKRAKRVKTRMLISSIIIRGLMTGLAIFVIFFFQIFLGKYNENSIAISMLLLCIAGIIETFGFLNVLAFQGGNYGLLIRIRVISTVIKFLLTVSLIFYFANIYYLCLLFYIDSIIIIFTSLYLVSEKSIISISIIKQYFSKISSKKLIIFCAKFFSISIPLILTLGLYNFILRSDRFFVTQMGSVNLFKNQTVAMQFIDPATMLFCGYLINLYLSGATLTINKIKKMMLFLLIIGLIFSISGDYIISFAPENIAQSSGYLIYYSWYIPAYGGFAIIFWSMFYYKYNSIKFIFIVPILFIITSFIVNYSLYLFVNGNLFLAPPILATIISVIVFISCSMGAKKIKIRSI